MASETGRTAFKLALLATPAIALSAVLGVWGGSLRAAAYDAFSRKGVTFEYNDHSFDLPDPAWRDQVTRFFDDFRALFHREQPFKNSNALGRVVERPLAPLKGRLNIVVTNGTGFRKEAFVETGVTLPFNGGYFNPTKSRIIIDAEGHGPDSPALNRSLSHELTHAIMHSTYPDAAWSPWLSEGFAQWCEVVDLKQPLGTRHTGRLREAAAEQMPLKQLIEANQAVFTAAGNNRYYHASYAFVAFLLEKRRPALQKYFDEEALNGPVKAAAFSELIGDPEVIQSEWREWLRTP